MRWAWLVARFRRGEACTWFKWGNLKERDRWGERGVEREDNIKNSLQAVGCGSMAWIKLAQDRDCWRALVNAVMKFRVA
jgi:hypothetical protein